MHFVVFEFIWSLPATGLDFNQYDSDLQKYCIIQATLIKILRGFIQTSQECIAENISPPLQNIIQMASDLI